MGSKQESLSRQQRACQAASPPPAKMFQTRAGLASLLKDGSRHYSGLEEATLRNIDACKKLAALTRTSLGPESMNKLIVSHIEKLFVTSDAATTVEQLEVQHPAAKVVEAAARMQHQEFGDGANFVVSFAGELLAQAGRLMGQGVHVADVIAGFELALQDCMRALPAVATVQLGDVFARETLARAARSAVLTKAGGAFGELLVRLVAEAAQMAMPKCAANFAAENVRVAKLTGGAPDQSAVVRGLLVARAPHGAVTNRHACKVLVLGCGLELAATEAKGTVLLNTAAELLNFTAGEEDRMDAAVRGLADAGVGAVVVGGHISDLAQHFCDKYGLLTLKVQSKFELQRLARSVGAAVLVKMPAADAPPAPESLGFAEIFERRELASKIVTVVAVPDSRLATVVLRGAMDSALDEAERAVEDGVAAIRAMARDNRFVAGGGAAELALAADVRRRATQIPGLEQYAAAAFADALELVPRILAENAGMKAVDVLTQLQALHAARGAAGGAGGAAGGGRALPAASSSPLGIVITPSGDASISDTSAAGVLDHFHTKETALKLATDAAITVLRVDQIIMARPAGGPKPPAESGAWDED